MKRFSALLALLLLAVLLPGRLLASAGPLTHADDTIIVKLPNQAVMTLFVKNKAQLREMRNYKLDSLLVLLDGYITQAEAAGKNSKSDAVTMEFYPAKDQPGKKVPEQIRITVRNENDQTTKKSTERVDVVLGRAFGVTVVEQKEGDNGHITVTTNTVSDSARLAQKKAKKDAYNNRAVHTNFNIDLGLNTLVNKSTQPGSQEMDLRPIGSRYVSLNWNYDIRVGKVGSVFHLITGPELAFNNYMLDNNLRFSDVNGTTLLLKEPTLNLEKSKLTMTTINLPLMPMLKFKGRNSGDGFRIGAGGFVGYRLGSHTKLKYDQEGRTRKDKDRGSYNLEDFQYGVQGLVGIRSFDLFVKYNLNDTFKASRGPGGQTLSFGVSLLN